MAKTVFPVPGEFRPIESGTPLAESSYIHDDANDQNLNVTLGNKVDKVQGKGLSTEDYTTDEKNKLRSVPGTFATVATTGNYSDLNNRPLIPDVSGKADKSEMSVTPGTGADADKTTIQLKQGTSATVLVSHQDISNKADKATTLAGYGITDGYTKTEGQALEDEIDSRLDSQDHAISLLNGNDVVVVADHTQVQNPSDHDIYREPEAVVAPATSPTYYIDWMYFDNQWKEIGKYSFPGIDNEPTADSVNLAKSGGIVSKYGDYENIPDYANILLDAERKYLEGTKIDGTKEFPYNVEVKGTLNVTGDAQIHEVSMSSAAFGELVSYNLQNSPEYIDVVIDNQNKIVSGIKADGTVVAYKYSADIVDVEKELILSDTAKEKLQEELSISGIQIDEKKEDFSSLFATAIGDVESFLFFSDPHYFLSYVNGGYDHCNMVPNAIEYISRFKDYFDNTPTDFVLCGGDWLDEHKQSIAIKDLGWIDGFMTKNFGDKYFPILGNHDNNYQGQLDTTTDRSIHDGEISNEVMSNLWFRKWGKMYYIFKGNKTKFFVFDSGIDWSTAMNEYRWEQVAWFASELLANTDEHLVIGIHIVTNSGDVFGDHVAGLADNVTKLANAFNSRTTITLNDVEYNFSNSQGKVHCALCGHVHYDGTAVVNGIPTYAIDDATTGNFDLILLDYNAHKLKSVRIGTGSDREMNLIN